MELTLERIMEREREDRSPCRITITFNKRGVYVARMSFAPGMESASGEGASIDAALTDLRNRLQWGH